MKAMGLKPVSKYFIFF